MFEPPNRLCFQVFGRIPCAARPRPFESAGGGARFAMTTFRHADRTTNNKLTVCYWPISPTSLRQGSTAIMPVTYRCRRLDRGWHTLYAARSLPARGRIGMSAHRPVCSAQLIRRTQYRWPPTQSSAAQKATTAPRQDLSVSLFC